MIELNEQQEQEMIDRAKAGDPEANYQMSLWALEQAMAEPEEERWNRLAAKCLVKAAEAGYAPAKEKMDELLAQTADPAADKPGQHEVGYTPRPETHAPTSAPEKDDAPVPEEPAAAGPDIKAALTKAGKAVAAGAAALAGKIRTLTAKKTDAGATQSGSAAASADGKKTGFFNFSEWDDAKWKKMQIVCIVVCVILALLIAIMLITGRSKKESKEEEVIIPAADVVTTPIPATPTPEPANYLTDEVKAEIAAADLDVYPEDADFVTEPTSRTVATTSSPLNVRKGTNSNASWVSSLESGSTVDIYAFKNGWALVKSGSVWGWCSNEYLK